MADMECLNNENHLESDLSNEAQITSEMDKIIEVVKKYDGATTDDIIVSVDNNKYTISATFTKHAIENMGKVDDILVNNESVIDEDKVARINVPTKLSQLTNDAGLIDNTVNNLVNYYNKSNTYTKSEVLALVADIPKFSVQIVSTLPTENISSTTIYLLHIEGGDSNNYYEEYIYANGRLELIGTTKIDLSNYYTKAETSELVEQALNGLSTVAKTGNYHDLYNKVPTASKEVTGTIRLWIDSEDYLCVSTKELLLENSQLTIINTNDTVAKQDSVLIIGG